MTKLFSSSTFEQSCLFYVDDISKMYPFYSGSPFKVRVVDEINPQNVRCFGPGLDPKGVRAGQPAPFTVDASTAGDAPLDVTVTDQLGSKRPAQITPRGDNVYDVVYTTEVEGAAKIDVLYANTHVPQR